MLPRATTLKQGRKSSTEEEGQHETFVGFHQQTVECTKHQPAFSFLGLLRGVDRYLGLFFEPTREAPIIAVDIAPVGHNVVCDI